MLIIVILLTIINQNNKQKGVMTMYNVTNQYGFILNLYSFKEEKDAMEFLLTNTYLYPEYRLKIVKE